MDQSIYRRHKVFLFLKIVVVLFLVFFLVPVNFAYCWYLGELSPVAGVNTYHIMHSPRRSQNSFGLSVFTDTFDPKPNSSQIYSVQKTDYPADKISDIAPLNLTVPGLYHRTSSMPLPRKRTKRRSIWNTYQRKGVDARACRKKVVKV